MSNQRVGLVKLKELSLLEEEDLRRDRESVMSLSGEGRTYGVVMILFDLPELLFERSE